MSYVLRTKKGEEYAPLDVQFTDPFDAISAATDNVSSTQDVYIIDNATGEVVGAMVKSTLQTISQDQERIKATLPSDDYETIILPENE